jgi:hypothetical protein
MAWEERGQQTYYYRSVRRDGRVTKEYYGAGPVGQFAAGVDALRRAERAAVGDAARAARIRLDEAVALINDLCRGCEVLAVGALLAAGFHRPSRHSWRRWRRGCRTLQQAG